MENWKIALLGLCLILNACAPIEHNVDGNIDVNLNIDVSQLEEYFKPVCENELPSANEVEINECVNLKIGEFLSVLSYNSGS